MDLLENIDAASSNIIGFIHVNSQCRLKALYWQLNDFIHQSKEYHTVVLKYVDDFNIIFTTGNKISVCSICTFILLVANIL